jgi:hypothetical protein
MKMIDEGLKVGSGATTDRDDDVPGNQPGTGTPASNPIEGA